MGGLGVAPLSKEDVLEILRGGSSARYFVDDLLHDNIMQIIPRNKSCLTSSPLLLCKPVVTDSVHF
jgi:hypothetical protein